MPDSFVNFLRLSQDLFKVHQIFRKIPWISCRASFRSSSFFPGFFRCPAEKKTKRTRKTQGDLMEVPQALKPRDFFTPPKFNSSPLKNDGTGRLRLSFLGARLIFGGFCCWNFQGVSRIQIKPNSPLEAIGNLPEPVSGAVDGVSWTELNFSPVFASFEYSTESVLERIFDDFLCGFWCWYLVFWDLQDGMFLTFLKADVSQRCLQGCKFGNNSFNSTLQIHTSKNHNQTNEYTETSHPKLTEKN